MNEMKLEMINQKKGLRNSIVPLFAASVGRSASARASSEAEPRGRMLGRSEVSEKRVGIDQGCSHSYTFMWSSDFIVTSAGMLRF